MLAACELRSGADAAQWRANPLRRSTELENTGMIRLAPTATTQMTLEEVILARRSTPHYDTHRQVPFSAFSTVLDYSARSFACDALAPDAPPLHDTYLIVNAVEGLQPGTYLYYWGVRALELLHSGEFRQQARRLAVFQDYTADAHVNSYSWRISIQFSSAMAIEGTGGARRGTASGRVHVAGR